METQIQSGMSLGTRNRRYKQVLSEANDHEFASMRIMAGIVFCRFCTQSFCITISVLYKQLLDVGKMKVRGALFAHEISYSNNITQGARKEVLNLKEGPPTPSMQALPFSTAFQLVYKLFPHKILDNCRVKNLSKCHRHMGQSL